MTKADRRALAGVVLAGCKVKRFNSQNRQGHWTRTDPNHPGYCGWYWTKPSSNTWIGAFSTQRECVAECKLWLDRWSP